MSVLSIEQVSKRYSNQILALNDVSLDVKAQQIFGLVGPNGAGKTTLIKCILDLVRADQGQISILGQPSTHSAARAKLGYLPEDHLLPEHLNAEQLLDFVGQLFELPARTRSERIDTLLTQVGLQKRRKSKLKTFSKGMRQRLGIAQALMNHPQLLILDEPNEGLDPIGRADIKDLLLDLKATGVTIFISSHVLAELETFCDHVGILHEGRLIGEGSVKELTHDKDLEKYFVELIREQRIPSEVE